jgi:hypothetical protein
MAVDPILGSVEALATVATTISQIQDTNKRREFEQNLAMLDNKQKLDLERALQKTNSVNKRMEILFNAVSQIRSAQTSSILSSTITAKAQKERTLAIAVVGGAVAILIAVILIKKL